MVEPGALGADESAVESHVRVSETTWRRALLPVACWLCPAVCCLGVSFSAHAQQRPWTLGAELALYFDDGSMHGSERRSILVEDEGFDFVNESHLAWALWGLRTLTERIRAGGGVRYLGAYEYSDKHDSAEEPEVFRLGHTFDAFAQGEYVVALVSRLDLIVSAQAGLVVLLPDGGFEQEIEALQMQGVSAWSVPRLGLFLGPQLGARYRLTDRLFVRGGLSFQWQQLFLLRIRDKVGEVVFHKTRRAGLARTRWGVAVEVAL